MTENGVVTSYAANAMNQYTVNGATYNYDGNFNLREAPNWGGDFDAQNHLMSAGHGGNVVFFTYDGLGRCVRRQVFVPSGASTTVLYTYDGWKPTMEWDGAGNLAAWNIYGAGADEILWRYTVVHGHLRYHHDRHGNVMFLLGPGGEALERYTYDAFGKPKIMDWAENERSESAVGNRFMFQGREWIAELGIYDYRHRMYKPELGRFLQTDPIGFDAGDMNLFRYCGDDSVDGSDPTGLLDTSASSNFWGNLMRFYHGNPSMDVVLDVWNQQQFGGLSMMTVAKSNNGGGLMPLPPDVVARMYAAQQKNAEEANNKDNWTPIQGTSKRQQEEYSTTIYRRGSSLTQIGPKKGHHVNGQPYSDIYGRNWEGGSRVAGTHIHVTGNGRHYGVDVDRARENRYISGVGNAAAPKLLNIYVPPRSGDGPGAFFHTFDGVKLYPDER
jgi:RHS repeat-associated protein